MCCGMQCGWSVHRVAAVAAGMLVAQRRRLCRRQDQITNVTPESYLLPSDNNTYQPVATAWTRDCLAAVLAWMCVNVSFLFCTATYWLPCFGNCTTEDFDQSKILCSDDLYWLPYVVAVNKYLVI